MAIKTINTVHTPEGLKLLKTPCVPIGEQLPQYEQLITDLMDTAAANPGCLGLTANQIWEYPEVPVPAIFVIPGSEKGTWAVCANPTIVTKWKKTIKALEGCMSIPGFRKEIERARHLSASFYSGDGVFQSEVHMFDLTARIFQHEMDHINGKLINER